MKRRPWVLTEAEARARDEAIFEQFTDAAKRADRFARPVQGMAWLKRQFGNLAIRQAIMRAVVRKQGART